MPRYAPNRHIILALSRKYGPVSSGGVVELTSIDRADTASITISKMKTAGLLRECIAAKGSYMLTAAGTDLLNAWDERKGVIDLQARENGSE